ncbi:hypothetical protein OFB62_28520, partial [Escherichia coli]|nr:hypothetical protein [Escherichia coli]
TQFEWKLYEKKIKSETQLLLKPNRQFEINVPAGDSKKTARVVQIEVMLRNKPPTSNKNKLEAEQAAKQESTTTTTVDPSAEQPQPESTQSVV